MSAPIAIISMLHESASGNSATRSFQGKPVLSSTLAQVSKISGVNSAFILCWDDQSPAVAEAVKALAVDKDASWCTLACKGRRRAVASLDAIAAAGRWMDGWRGGLLQSCDFDIGFHGKWIAELVGDRDVLLIDPAAGALDLNLIEKVLDRSEQRPDLDMVFTQAAPGLCGVLLRSSLLLQLANADQHPGKLLHYLPDRPSRDPIAGEACVEVPTEMARTTRHFKLNSIRQIQRFEDKSSIGSTVQTADCPRELMLEITTCRSTFPAFGSAKHFPIARPDLTIELAQKIFQEFGSIDDLRLTLGGVGDPLCHPNFFEIVESARAVGITAIHVETDLYELDTAQVAGLVEAGIDIISVNIPALTPGTYQKLMGINGYETVIQNIKQLVLRRQGLGRGTPIVVPTFVKCRENFTEMEPWYDQWLKALGTAVITGPTIFDDASPSLSDMTPPKRKACARLNHRMTILSDGQIVSCDNDVFARQVLGQIKTETALKIWNGPASQLRADHAQGQWQKHSLCASCKEWYRP